MLPTTRDTLRKSADFKRLVLDVISNTIKNTWTTSQQEMEFKVMLTVYY